MVRDDLNLLDDSEKVLKPNKVIDNSILDCEIVPLLDEKFKHVVKRLMCSQTKFIIKETLNIE